VATQAVPLTRDFPSEVKNQAHIDQKIDMSGAVRRRISARSMFVAAIIRLARLCVLILGTRSCPAFDPHGPCRKWHPQSCRACRLKFARVAKSGGIQALRTTKASLKML